MLRACNGLHPAPWSPPFALERQIPERSMATMSRHVLHVNYVDVLPMLGAAMTFLWLTR